MLLCTQIIMAVCYFWQRQRDPSHVEYQILKKNMNSVLNPAFSPWYKIGEPSYLSKKKNEWHSKRIVTKEESTGSYTKYSKSCNIWKTKLENIVCSRDRIWNIWQKNGIEYVTCLTRSENYRTPIRIKEPKLEAAIGRK